MKSRCTIIAGTYLRVKQCGGYVGFTIHFSIPTVERLTFHLFDEQTVMFTDDDEVKAKY